MSHYLNAERQGFLRELSECLPNVDSGALRCRIARVARTLMVWDQRYQQRRALRELSPELLRDIGISESDARLEAAKPFWKA